MVLIILFATLIVCSLLWIFMKWSQVKKYWSNRGVPHLSPHPILGSLTFFQIENSALWIIRLYKQFKSPYIGIWLMWKPALIINSPELARRILNRDFTNFRNRYVSSGVTDPIGSLNLFTVKDPLWSKVRKSLTNIFTTSRLKNQQNYTLTKSRELVQRIKNEGDNRINLKDLFVDYTTDVIGTFAFGIESTATLTGKGPLRTISDDFIKFSIYRGLSLFLIFFWPAMVDIFRFKFLPRSAENYFCQVIECVLAGRSNKNMKRYDLIDALIKFQEDCNGKNEKIPKDLLVAQAAVFLFVGFDTSATTLTFAIYEIAYNPRVQEKIYQELKNAQLRLGTKDFDMNSLEELPYMNCVVSETLRKYAPMVWIDRIAIDDYEIDEKLTIKGGTPVYINALGMHYDPYYFPDPYQFYPERFLPENKSNIKPYTYLPFGDGPRSCLGQRYAFMTVRTALVELFLNYKVQPLPNMPSPNEVEIDKISLFYTPGEPLSVDFITRND